MGRTAVTFLDANGDRGGFGAKVYSKMDDELIKRGRKTEREIKEVENIHHAGRLKFKGERDTRAAKSYIIIESGYVPKGCMYTENQKHFIVNNYKPGNGPFIAECIGVTPGALSVQISRMRQNGDWEKYKAVATAIDTNCEVKE